MTYTKNKKEQDKDNKGRNGKMELYTWLEKDKYEELAKIAKDKGIPLSSLGRVAILNFLGKLRKNPKVVL